MAKARVRKNADPITFKILENLEGDWTPYVPFIREMAKLVPGEVAWRTAERERERHHRNDGKEEIPPRRFNDDTAVILTGSRTYVRKLIQHLHRAGRVELLYEQKKVYKKPISIRLSPDEVALRH